MKKSDKKRLAKFSLLTAEFLVIGGLVKRLYEGDPTAKVNLGNSQYMSIQTKPIIDRTMLEVSKRWSSCPHTRKCAFKNELEAETIFLETEIASFLRTVNKYDSLEQMRHTVRPELKPVQ